MTHIQKRWLRRIAVALAVCVLVSGLLIQYVHTYPLVFNESFWEHAHCIKAGALGLLSYADDHQGKLPAHPGGYGDALLLIEPGYYSCLTGPGYDDAPFLNAKREGKHLNENDCGRVYIQGLSTNLKSGTSKVAILFDKLPTPGGDHCHLLARLSAPLGREVAFGDAHSEFVPLQDWPAFAQHQIDLLVNEGIDRREAKRLYASQPNVPK